MEKSPKTKADAVKALKRVNAALKQHGLLLLSDASLPSVAGLIAGEPIKGSWWGHPAGNLIFNTCVALEHGGKVIATRIVNGKVTFVDASLWPAVVAVGSERARWQTAKLSAPAKCMLVALSKSNSGSLRSDQLPKNLQLAGKKPGDVMKELEMRLLVDATEVHTESGAHAKLIRSWRAFVDELSPVMRRAWVERSAADGRAELEAAAKKLAGRHKVKLPW